MDKLEQYLDQVCRSIGGPKSLRQHVRQELREHLRDAVAEHQATGLTADDALARALEDFGGPDQVRSELEATHGHRLLPVVIDKAMHWKEKTMKAKWLWTSWANLAVVGVIVLEVLFITFAEIYLVPKFHRLMQDGLIDPAILQEQDAEWMASFLKRLDWVGNHLTTWCVLLAAAAWGLFEWRVRSENKSFMRLSVLGTAAAGLMLVVALTAGSLIIPYMLAAPATARIARPFALSQLAEVNSAVHTLEEALARQDWAAMPAHAAQASQSIDLLVAAGPAVTSLSGQRDRFSPNSLEELRTKLQSASDSLRESTEAIRQKDSTRVASALQKFHSVYDPLEKTARN